MGSMKDLMKEAAALCRKKERFALATVLESEGSTPRGAGSKMLVRADGTALGTVGGGKIESEVIGEARVCLERGESRIRRFLLDGKSADDTDMTCGGRADVLIQGLDGSGKSLGDLFLRADRGYLITRVERAGGELKTALSLWAPPEGGELAPLLADHPDYLRTGEKEGKFLMAEALERGWCVYICGGGHVGEKTAWLADFAGFDTVVVEDRSEFADPKRFPHAREVLLRPEYVDAFSALERGKRTFVVIMTRGHRYDRDVLEQALKTDAAYIGMMGSRRKIAFINDSLRQRGFSDGDLARVTAPIGLPIASETPEEIAVSILAQLIEKRRMPERDGD